MLSTQQQQLILRTDQEGISTLTLNRPAQFNALSLDLLKELFSQLQSISENPEIRVVIIAAEGKAFSAGHDLKEMRADRTQSFGDRLFAACTDVMLAIHRLPQPVIARVQGIATAAGCQLVAACDLAVAADHTRFATSGVNFGLFCSTPAVALSRNVGVKQSLEMLLTGEFISAEKAQEYGLVNRVVPARELHSATRELAEKIAAQSPAAIRLGKEMFYRQLSMALPEAYAFASERIVCNMLEEDVREGFDAFVEKRKPVWGK